MKDTVQELLRKADTDVQIDGDRPWDLEVHDPRLYRRIVKEGSLGLGEAYMDGWWDCKALDQFFYRVLSAQLDRQIDIPLQAVWNRVKAAVINLQSRSRAYTIGERHYDIGNDLYLRMLDDRMVYSCGYWKEAETLNEAQEAKLDLICRKVGLQSGMRVLDIGCGWGGFAAYAAENYNVEVVGVTVSKEQVEFGRDHWSGLPIDIRLQDYRDLDEPFDRIVSVGMFEHVGYKNYRTFMEVVDRCLKKNGLFLLHCIGTDQSGTTADAWINKYIFPNGMIPSAKQISIAAEGLFALEDWHNFGAYYDKTLMAWHDNFVSHWGELNGRYDDRFYRMWTYYLLMSAGSFRARKNHLWQIVFSRNGVPGGYESIR